MTEITLQAYEVLEEFRKTLNIEELKRLKMLIDQTYQDEIKLFKAAEKTYQSTLNEGGIYHPDYKASASKFSEAKANLYQKEEVKTYFKLEKEIQSVLNQFVDDFTQKVSSYIQTPNELGITKKGGHSCGHK